MDSYHLINHSDSSFSFEMLLETCQTDDIPLEQKNKLVEDFIKNNNYDFPLIKDSEVYFVFVGKATLIHVVGDFNSWDSFDDSSEMTKVSDTNLFYLKKSFPDDSRFDYQFVVDTNWNLDPLNKKKIMGGFGYNSELVMPNHKMNAEDIENIDEIPKGTIEELFFQSEIQKKWKRKIYIYLPPGYEQNSSENFPSFYAVDGTDYLTAGNIKQVLDKNIYLKNFPPLIGIFIDPLTPALRIRDFNGDSCREPQDQINFSGKTGICRKNYCEFLINELIPYIDHNYRTITNNPLKRAHVGVSLGGILSAYVGLNFSTTFNLIGSQSGAFWIDKSVYSGFEKHRTIIGMKFYLNAGTFEHRICRHTKLFSEILKNKNYEYQEEYFNQGHSWGLWKETFGRMISYLFNE